MNPKPPLSSGNQNKKPQEKQTYKYIKNNSIIHNLKDEYEFTKDEYYLLYQFFVTYSMCGKQSSKIREIDDYGWKSKKTDQKNDIVTSGLKSALSSILDLDTNPMFILTEKDNLREKFAEVNLTDGNPTEIITERAVIGKTLSESNSYFKLFYRVRDGFAHGKFVLRLGENNEKMLIIQDDDRYNVTARIIIKKDTLLDYVRTIDKNNLLNSKS